MAMICSEGYIDDFTITGNYNTSFPKLQKRNKAATTFTKVNVPYHYFGVSRGESLYFLSTDPNVPVTKLDIDGGSMKHEIIENSFIPNHHFLGEIRGLNVGNDFWIFGGMLHASIDTEGWTGVLPDMASGGGMGMEIREKLIQYLRRSALHC